MSPTLSGIHEALWVLLYGAMIPTPGFHHLHLNSVDPDAAIDFYVRQFPTPGSPSCEARANVSAILPPEFKQQYCVNVVSFVPQPGRRYQVKQDQSAKSCSTFVTDIETAQPPPDLVHPVIKEPCKIR